MHGNLVVIYQNSFLFHKRQFFLPNISALWTKASFRRNRPQLSDASWSASIKIAKANFVAIEF